MAIIFGNMMIKMFDVATISVLRMVLILLLFESPCFLPLGGRADK